MTGEDENARGDRERRLERKAAAAFDASVHGLDADTRSRLNRRRQAALAELDRVGLRPWLQWAPAGGFAAAAALVVFAWTARQPAVDVVAYPAATDFEILLNTDDLEMLEELEFYSWMELDEENGTNGNVG